MEKTRGLSESVHPDYEATFATAFAATFAVTFAATLSRFQGAHDSGSGEDIEKRLGFIGTKQIIFDHDFSRPKTKCLSQSTACSSMSALTFGKQTLSGSVFSGTDQGKQAD